MSCSFLEGVGVQGEREETMHGGGVCSISGYADEPVRVNKTLKRTRRLPKDPQTDRYS